MAWFTSPPKAPLPLDALVAGWGEVKSESPAYSAWAFYYEHKAEIDEPLQQDRVTTAT